MRSNNFKNYKSFQKISSLLLVSIFIFSLFLLPSCKPTCTSINEVNASIEIVSGTRSLIGFNTEKDSLKFGRVSPGAIVKRTIEVSHTPPAEVIVAATGNLSSWIKIEPVEFSLVPDQIQEVTFQAIIPSDAANGNYFGRVQFCFRYS